MPSEIGETKSLTLRLATTCIRESFVKRVYSKPLSKPLLCPTWSLAATPSLPRRFFSAISAASSAIAFSWLLRKSRASSCLASSTDSAARAVSRAAWMRASASVART